MRTHELVDTANDVVVVQRVRCELGGVHHEKARVCSGHCWDEARIPEYLQWLHFDGAVDMQIDDVARLQPRKHRA